MVEININIQKKDLWLLSAIAVFLVGVGYVIAYNSGAIPEVMGHSAEELEGVCLSNGINCPSFSSEGYKLLAQGFDWTEEAIITITSSGISFDTDQEYGFQKVNPVLYGLPSGISEIIFKVKNDGDDYCVGGNGVLSLDEGTGTNAKCTDYQYQGTTLTKLNSEQDDWIRLSINGIEMNECPDQLERTPNSGYVGKYGEGFSHGTFCIYSKINGDWTGEITELKIEEADWSGSFGAWEWEIWYK